MKIFRRVPIRRFLFVEPPPPAMMTFPLDTMAGL
jgi:hypothetical protein